MENVTQDAWDFWRYVFHCLYEVCRALIGFDAKSELIRFLLNKGLNDRVQAFGMPLRMCELLHDELEVISHDPSGAFYQVCVMAVYSRRLTMFRPIRIRTGSANFYPYNTPPRFVNNTP